MSNDERIEVELEQLNLECFIEQNREMDGECEDVRGDEDAS